MNRGNRKDLVEPKFAELGDTRHRAIRIYFIHRDEHRFAALAQPLGGFSVERNDPFLHVYHQNNHICSIDREFDLVEGGPRNDIHGILATQQSDSARINESETVTVPFGFGRNSIARDAWLVVNDGDAAARDPIEQSGFSDVGPADNGD